MPAPNTADLLTTNIRAALTSREQVANVAVFLPFVRLSREVSSPDGQVGTPEDATSSANHPTFIVRGIRYCHRCGNPDCPAVSDTPYWQRCPAVEGFGMPSVDLPEEPADRLADLLGRPERMETK